MRLFKYPEHFCSNTRPYWVLFGIFVISNALLIYTLYTRQPERYHRLGDWVPSPAKQLADLPLLPKMGAEGPATTAEAPAPLTKVPAATVQTAPQPRAVQGPAGGAVALPRANPKPVAVPTGLPKPAAAAGGSVAFLGMMMVDAPMKPTAKATPNRPTYGVKVESITQASVPYNSGFRQGDVIVSVNRIPTRTVGDLQTAVGQMDPSRGLLFDVYSQGQFRFVTIEPNLLTP